MTDVAVVIPTYNRGKPLARCLEALTRQAVPPSEVIVVDDGSPVPVSEANSSEWSRLLPLRVIRNDANRGPAYSRNVGVRATKADLILFLDDDVAATPNLITHHLEARRQVPRAAVIGPLAAPPDWRPTPWNLWEARSLAVEYERMKRREYAPTWRQFFTGNASVAREDFIEVGGFDERFTRAEDIELGIRLGHLGCEFVFEDRAIGWHYATRSRESWLRIPREYARFDELIDALYPELHWMDVVESELRARHPLVRFARAALRPIRLERSGAATAMAGASMLFRCGLTPPALAALSLSFTLEYSASQGDRRPGTTHRDIARV
jgi:GT2 family glycosyltransferase